jgi:cobalamin biosynthesis protein CobT
MAVQQLFMPDVAILRARDEAERKRVGATPPVPGMKAQDMKLWLPSLREGHEVRQAGYMKGIRDRFAAQWKDTAKFIAHARDMYAEMKADDAVPESGADKEDENDDDDEESDADDAE